MKTVKEYLLVIRFEAIKADLKYILWHIYSTSIIIFISALTIENIFYLSSSIRVKVWISLAVIFIIFITLLTVVSIQIKNNRLKRYKLEFIAKNTGKFAFSKQDNLINALQIENSKETLYSEDLSNSFIKQTIDKLSKLKISFLFPSKKIYLWKKITLICLIITLLTIISTWKHSVSSMYRWAHAKTEFIPPKPFKLIGLTRHLNVLGGENVNIGFKATGEIPDSIFIEFRPVFNIENKDSTIIFSAKKSNVDEYKFEFLEIYQNFQYRAFSPSIKFWDPWDEITTKFFSISVTDRPSIDDFLVTITPPAYTGLKKQSQKANQAQIQAINGSKINVELKSNKDLSLAELILDEEKKEMNINGKRAQFEFIASLDQKFSINLKDKRGVRNRNPIPFNLQIINDISPEMTIIQPPPIIELGSDQTIPILMSIEDDFGFSNLQLSYELQRPNYIDAEPFISLFNIEINKSSKTQQDIQTIWNLQSIGLMPEDEIYFHFELYDNDIVTGPKKTISSTFIARLPSLNDLFHSFNDEQEQIIDAVKIELEDIQKLKVELDKAELNLLKKDKLEWKDNQSLKETLESVQQQLDDFQTLAEQINQLNDNGEKHQLFSKDLMNKFEDLQKLIEEIFPPDMLKNMDWMKKALEDMKPEELLSALENLSNNIQQVEKELDRFLDIFKRVKAEQEVDQLRKRLEQLVQNQDNIDQQIRQTNNETNASKFKKLEQEQKINKREFDEIISSMEDAAKDVKVFSRKTAQSLEKLSESELSKSTENHLEQTIQSLNKEEPYKAMDESYASLNDIETVELEMDNILSEFQKETTRDMSSKFRLILKDLLTLSKSQESLKSETEQIPRNSPGLHDLALEQQMIQNQLTQAMENAVSLSKETFLVSPMMGRMLGSAYAQMNVSKGKLAERNGNGSIDNQDEAIIALNEGSKIIIQSIKQMQESGSASGYNQFLKQLEQMAGKQQGINNQGMQLALGQMANSLKNSIMQQMLAQQKGVRKSLQKMLNEMKKSGNQGLGDLNSISKEMNDVIKDLEEKKYTQSTSNKQKKILSRMLDSQTSMTQRGIDNNRKSESSEQITFENINGMPEDLGQRQSIIFNAMNKALNSGYSRDYQNMIRRYFNSLNQTQRSFLPDTMQNKLPIEIIE
jgi:hypothetical protein